MIIRKYNINIPNDYVRALRLTMRSAGDMVSRCVALTNILSDIYFVLAYI